MRVCPDKMFSILLVSILVFKGCEATAIYGYRAANGEILITTKNKKARIEIQAVVLNLAYLIHANTM